MNRPNRCCRSQSYDNTYKTKQVTPYDRHKSKSNVLLLTDPKLHTFNENSDSEPYHYRNDEKSLRKRSISLSLTSTVQRPSAADKRNMSIVPKEDNISPRKKANNDTTSILVAPHFVKYQIIPGVCGLRNLGNSCYMNSALQCLNSIPQLANLFRNFSIKLNANNLISSYAKLVQTMWSGQNSNTATDELKREVRKYAPQFGGYDQCDALEFLITLLDNLKDEMEKLITTTSTSSNIEQLFNIQMISQVTCHACGVTGSGTESMMFLSLPLPDNCDAPITLSSLLDLFEKEEKLDGQIYCDSCGQIATGNQKTILDELPPFIIVQLKRFPFDGTRNKVKTIIDYPLTDFDFYRRTQTASEHLYDLIAVSMHSGSLASGHYTANVYHNPSKKWYHINDAYYECIENLEEIGCSPNAYILIYAKKTNFK